MNEFLSNPQFLLQAVGTLIVVASVIVTQRVSIFYIEKRMDRLAAELSSLRRDFQDLSIKVGKLEAYREPAA